MSKGDNLLSVKPRWDSVHACNHMFAPFLVCRRGLYCPLLF